MERILVRDVFTPTKPARVAFVERDRINEKLVNSLTTPGKQIVVYGHSGTGKTTLLANKLTQLYEKHITTRCMKGLSFDQLILDAFDQLAPFYINERSVARIDKLGVDLGATYEMLQAKIAASTSTESTEKQSRIIPPQLTPQALGKFLGAQRACWVLEDFHKVEQTEKEKLAQLMKVFMDLSDDYGDLKIIALGAVDTARQVVDCDREMHNRVAEIHVDLMTENEIEQIISKGERALNIEFGLDIKKLVSRHSNGLPSVCHHLCLNMCNAAGIVETILGEKLKLTLAHCEQALKTYIDEASDSIKGAFDKALKKRRKTHYDNASLILRALSRSPHTGAARMDIHRRIQQSEAKYPEANIKYLLPRLCTSEYGEILRYDSNSGLYSFSDPIYRVYALARFTAPSERDRMALKKNELEQILLKAFNAAMEKNQAGKLEISITGVTRG